MSWLALNKVVYPLKSVDENRLNDLPVLANLLCHRYDNPMHSGHYSKLNTYFQVARIFRSPISLLARFRNRYLSVLISSTSHNCNLFMLRVFYYIYKEDLVHNKCTVAASVAEW